LVPLRSNAGMQGDVEAFRITTTTGPWTPEAWQEELEALTRHVKLCFEEATPLFAPPSEDSCRHFANYLLTYFLPEPEKRTLGSKEKAIKYGRTFLKHLAQEQEIAQLNLRLSIAVKSDAPRKEAEMILFHMEGAKRHLEYLFNELSPKRRPKNEPIRWLADLAQDLWRETNGGQAPRSKKADGPICRFLVPVLKAIHRNPSPATIAEALRGRR
jgi:hypothetical protein